VSEEADADDDVAREGQALLRLQELLLETRAAAEGYDWVFADHEIYFNKCRLLSLSRISIC